MKKVTIIGAGNVGSTIAYSLILSNDVEEIAIIDINKELVKAQVMDLEHSVPFVGRTKVKVGDYKDCADTDVVVITCGVAQKDGETRLDLVGKNSQIIKSILPKIFEQNENIVVVMVTNPVDVLTQIAVSMYPDKEKQILGTGTLLDSARFRHLIGEYLNLNPKSVHAYIIGEHGDSELPLWSTASVGNMNIGSCGNITESDKKIIFTKAKNAAYAIIDGKQSTYYAIGAGTSRLINAILFNKNTVLPVSHYIKDHYGVKDVCLSMPVVVGRGGIVSRLCVQVSKEEEILLKKSAEIIKDTVKKVA